MKLLAIDPGTEQSAYVIWNGNKILSKGIVPNETMNSLCKAGELHDHVAIEMVASYGMPVGKDVFETVFWIGRFWESTITGGFKQDLVKVYRKDVKMHLCNSVRAKDSNIRQALVDKFGKPGTKKEPNLVYNDVKDKMSKDLWAALSVAVYYTEADAVEKQVSKPKFGPEDDLPF